MLPPFSTPFQLLLHTFSATYKRRTCGEPAEMVRRWCGEPPLCILCFRTVFCLHPGVMLSVSSESVFVILAVSFQNNFMLSLIINTCRHLSTTYSLTFVNIFVLAFPCRKKNIFKTDFQLFFRSFQRVQNLN